MQEYNETMKIYIAAKDKAFSSALGSLLETNGHTILSSSSDPAPVTDEDKESSALSHISSIQDSDVFVLVSGPVTKGARHVATGLALAFGKRIFVLGTRENMFHWHPSVTLCATAKDLVDALAVV